MLKLNVSISVSLRDDGKNLFLLLSNACHKLYSPVDWILTLASSPPAFTSPILPLVIMTFTFMITAYEIRRTCILAYTSQGLTELLK